MPFSTNRMTNISNLKRKIMLRVYLIFVIRKLKNPIVFEVSIFALLFLTLAYMVSIERIIASTPHDISGFYHFWLSAFLGTKLLVKAITLLAILIMGILLKNMAKYTYVSTTNKFFARA